MRWIWFAKMRIWLCEASCLVVLLLGQDVHETFLRSGGDCEV